MNSYNIHFEWINLPLAWWLPPAILLVLLLMMIMWQLRSLFLSRLLAIIAFSLLFVTPYVTQTTLAPLPPLAIIITDQSPSMQLGKRPSQSTQISEWLEQQLQEAGEIEIQHYDIAQNSITQTDIMHELKSLIQQHDPARIAAVFLITDGEISDINHVEWNKTWPPLHALLVGAPNQQQAYVELDSVPPYVMRGEIAPVRLRAHWPAGSGMHNETILTISSAGKIWKQKINLNEWQSVKLPIEHQGMNRFVISLPPFKNAIFPATQTAVVDIQGIAAPLRILWQSNRNMPPWLAALQNDPLVKIETKNSDYSKDYDIIILDNALTKDFTPTLQNHFITYLKNGGRILLLQDITPTADLQPYMQQALPILWDKEIMPLSKVIITPSGLMHPVTANFASDIPDIELHSAALPVQQINAKPLIATEKGSPVLILSEFDQGRIASVLAPDILMNDPELPRTMIRWLMNDPALSEHAITFREANDEIQIEYLNNNPAIQSLRITRPDGTSFERQISSNNPGFGRTSFRPDQIGAYLISDGTERAAYVKGNIMVPEFQAAAATSTKLAPLVQKSGGQILWISKTPKPKLRWVTPPQRGGTDWLALHETRAFISTEATTSLLLPKLLLLLLIGSALGYAWWRETN